MMFTFFSITSWTRAMSEVWSTWCCPEHPRSRYLSQDLRGKLRKLKWELTTVGARFKFVRGYCKAYNMKPSNTFLVWVRIYALECVKFAISPISHNVASWSVNWGSLYSSQFTDIGVFSLGFTFWSKCMFMYCIDFFFPPRANNWYNRTTHMQRMGISLIKGICL